MKILLGSSNIKLGKKISHALHAEEVNSNITSFADGECKIEINEKIKRNEEILIVQSLNKDKFIIETLLIIDALKRLGVTKITLIAPYLGYLRQDRRAYENAAIGVPIAAKVIADLINFSGVSDVITLDIHFQQFEGFLNIPLHNLSADDVFTRYIIDNNIKRNAVIVSPDLGAAKKAKAFAKRMDVGAVIINKHRSTDGLSEVTDVIGDVKDKSCIILDDLICGGGTLCNAAKKLNELGASSVRAFITHGVFGGDIMKGVKERIHNSCVDKLFITDSIDTSIDSEKIVTLSSDAIFADYVRDLAL